MCQLYIQFCLFSESAISATIFIPYTSISSIDPYAFASGIVDKFPGNQSGPYELAVIPNDMFEKDDTIEVWYRVRRDGESAILEGTTDITIENLPDTVPSVITLLQNSPNPFNPSTTISFSLPDDDHVRLSIYTVEGKLVNTVVIGDTRCQTLVLVVKAAQVMGMVMRETKSKNLKLNMLLL